MLTHLCNKVIWQFLWPISFVLFSSPETLGSQGELIVHVYASSRHPSVRLSSSVHHFQISETAWPIKTKFNVEPPWKGGTKVCINGPGHMTKRAATPIHGQNLLKSSPEPEAL